jgi:hypothetical protein
VAFVDIVGRIYGTDVPGLDSMLAGNRIASLHTNRVHGSISGYTHIQNTARHKVQVLGGCVLEVLGTVPIVAGDRVPGRNQTHLCPSIGPNFLELRVWKRASSMISMDTAAGLPEYVIQPTF